MPSLKSSKERSISESSSDLVIYGLELKYPQAAQALWTEVSLVLLPGELGAVSGPNSCGKTSLLNAISGVVPHYIKAELRGSIIHGNTDLIGMPLNEKYHHLGYLMADVRAQLLFPTGFDEVSFALENLGLPPDEITHRVEAAAVFFGIQELLPRHPHSLSGGEQKLLLMAGLEALQPPLLLLDEPEAALSERSLELLVKWLMILQSRGQIALLATHSDILQTLCSKQLVLD